MTSGGVSTMTTQQTVKLMDPWNALLTVTRNMPMSLLFYINRTAWKCKEVFESEDVKTKLKDAGVTGEPLVVYLCEVKRDIT